MCRAETSCLKRTAPPRVRERIEKKLAGENALPVTVIVRTPAELKKVLGNNPFPEAVPKASGVAKKTTAPFTLYVAFITVHRCQGSFTQTGRNKHQQEHSRGRTEIYLCYANGYGNSKMTNNLFEKLLAARATTPQLEYREQAIRAGDKLMVAHGKMHRVQPTIGCFCGLAPGCRAEVCAGPRVQHSETRGWRTD